MSASRSLAICFLVLSFVLVFTNNHAVEATYRKPPFNGSIFGKRANNNDYDSGGKALAAMCEIAIEACQSWQSTWPQDKK